MLWLDDAQDTLAEAVATRIVAQETRGHARTARAAARATRERARRTLATSLTVVVDALALRGIHGFRGASDQGGAALIIAAIRAATLCWRCIADKCAMTAQQADDAMAQLRRMVRVDLALAPCEQCQERRLVYSVGRPMNGASDVEASVIIGMITRVRQCVDCIATSTGMGRPLIDETLVAIRRTQNVTTTVDRCDRCLRQMVVHRLE